MHFLRGIFSGGYCKSLEGVGTEQGMQRSQMSEICIKDLLVGEVISKVLILLVPKENIWEHENNF